MTEAVINQNQQAQAFSPFGKRNANKDKIEQEEAELKQLAEDKSTPQDPEDSNLSAEEKSFKKRYGDLRRHSQQKELSFQKQIDELKEQLTKSTEKQIKLPTSEADLAEWAKTYPDVAKIVETIAIKKQRNNRQLLKSV